MKLLIASMLGGVLMGDTTGIGQFMISRPIFCGPVIGLVTGDIITGLHIGIIMELLWITILPLGGAVPPDPSAVTVSATYLGVVTGKDLGIGYIMFLLIFLVPTGMLFKKIDMIQRDFNTFFSHKIEDNIIECDASCIEKVVYTSLFLFIFKAFIFLLIIMSVGEKILPFLYQKLGMGFRGSLAEAFYVIPSIGLGSLIVTFLFKKYQFKK